MIELPRSAHGSASVLQHAATLKGVGLSPPYHHHLPCFLVRDPIGYLHLLAVRHELGELVVLLHSSLQELVLQVGHAIPPARADVSYSIVDDLAQTPTTMSVLEVLKTCPTQ